MKRILTAILVFGIHPFFHFTLPLVDVLFHLIPILILFTGVSKKCV